MTTETDISSGLSSAGLKPLGTNFADPTDVLRFLVEEADQGRACALIIVTDTEGGGVRAPGALAGVSETGSCAGYVSNGCVDADMFMQARAAIDDGKVRRLRYGSGSPYMDIRLPCGGAVDVMVIPNPDRAAVKTLLTRLETREPTAFYGSQAKGLELADYTSKPAGWSDDQFYVPCAPKLRLRIAGRGTEPIALMRAAHALDFDVILQSPDEDKLSAAQALGFQRERLISTSDAPPCHDDSFTAFVMMFHDHEWEEELLKSALNGQAFYIGALGGRKTHAARCENLRKAGVSKAKIARIKGPIGLVSPVRNASFLAVSVLAEIIQAMKVRAYLSY